MKDGRRRRRAWGILQGVRSSSPRRHPRRRRRGGRQMKR